MPHRACTTEKGSDLIPHPLSSADTRPASVGQGFPSSVNEAENDHALPLTLKLEGMSCPACGGLIEDALKKTKGVVEASVLFHSDLAHITYLPHLLSPNEIAERISALGYRAALLEQQPESSKAKRALLVRLGISCLFTTYIMMISFALYCGFFKELSDRATRFLSYPLGLLATPVVFYGGFPILKRAYSGLRQLTTSMDTLISVGVLSAYLYSLVQMMTGSLHVYFDTAAMLVTLVLLGKYIEARAREKVSGGMQELYRLANQKVRLRNGGGERWVSAERVTPGEGFFVVARERIPLDGRITSGHGRVDESILTGESKPVKKSAGNDVMGGTLLLEGELSVEATMVGPESSLGQLITLVEQALSNKNPIELVADRITRWFVPAILVLATATALWMWVQGVSLDNALLRALAVLVISCPCALGIATPLAKVAAVGAGRMKGIVIRDPSALEQAKDLDAVVFDKTGTMTEGSFSLQQVVALEASEEEALRWIAALELHSDHFIAREILRKTSAMSLIEEEAHHFEELPGLGVKGVVNEMTVVVGNRRLLTTEGMSLPPSLDGKAKRLELEGNTVVFFGWKGSTKGLLSFGDRVKDSAKRAVQDLRSRGISTWLVSGDARETTQAVANALGIDQSMGQALPQDKVAIIKKLREEGRRVGMLGDGFNDAAALAEADVGFAMGGGANLAREASDITLLGHDLACLCDALDLSAFTMKTIRQNLAFAFLYNLLCIPLAIMGVVNPLVAVFAMFASSLMVVGNSSRILRRQELLTSPLPLIPSTEPA